MVRRNSPSRNGTVTVRARVERLHRFDYDEPMLAEWSTLVKSQAWDDAYVFFKQDEGAGAGPPAVAAFARICGAASAPVSRVGVFRYPCAATSRTMSRRVALVNKRL